MSDKFIILKFNQIDIIYSIIYSMNNSNHIRYHYLSLIGGSRGFFTLEILQVCVDGPPPLLPGALMVPAHEDVLPGEKIKSDAGNK